MKRGYWSQEVSNERGVDMTKRCFVLALFFVVLLISACADNTTHLPGGTDTTTVDGDPAISENDSAASDFSDDLASDEEPSDTEPPLDKDTVRPDTDTIDSVCIEHWDCSEGLFCRRNVGACAGPGVCAMMPSACDMVSAPVCGCDGLTYPNECEAHRGGHNVSYDGVCEPGASCLDTTDCGEGTFCLPPVGLCGGQGTCHPYPDNECPPVSDPVCGCDGITHQNECAARVVGSGVAHSGPCGSMLSCTDDKQCTETEYCAKPVGSCNKDDKGRCDLLRTSCDGIGSPMLVCGCDDITYDHPCFAALNGINIKYEGACEGTDVCLSNGDCGNDEFCRKNTGVCDKGSGVCEKRPDACAMAAPGEPVCGCDGLTYPDECNAHLVGMNVAFEGSCEDAIPKSSLSYHFNVQESPTVTAYAFVARSKDDTAEFITATEVEKMNTNPVNIILRVTYFVESPIPEQESVAVQVSLPRIANVPYTATLDDNANYVRWIDMFGNVKATFTGSLSVTAYQTDNDFPNYTVQLVDFFGENLFPKK